jgi:hypothetical protein
VAVLVWGVVLSYWRSISQFQCLMGLVHFFSLARVLT